MVRGLELSNPLQELSNPLASCHFIQGHNQGPRAAPFPRLTHHTRAAMAINPLSELIPAPGIESKDHDLCTDPDVAAGSNFKKRKATEPASRSNADALDVSGVKVYDKLLAKGLAPNGEPAWFQAVVIGLQDRSSQSTFIKYTTTMDGSIDPRALPWPHNALVLKVDTMLAREEEAKREVCSLNIRAWSLDRRG